VINVSSVHQTIPKPNYLGYSVSKGGMQNPTRTLALELDGRDERSRPVARRSVSDHPQHRAVARDGGGIGPARSRIG
jgi:NAD(P)-dependent dehydrogenase (short-subunit alcohol dehydrogenase family)